LIDEATRRGQKKLRRGVFYRREEIDLPGSMVLWGAGGRPVSRSENKPSGKGEEG